MPGIQPVPLPPFGTEEISTACDYCVVECSYRIWRWKVGAGGTANSSVPWANPSQHNIVQWQGEHAWSVKAYSYQYFENTYAITRLALDAIGPPA